MKSNPFELSGLNYLLKSLDSLSISLLKEGVKLKSGLVSGENIAGK